MVISKNQFGVRSENKFYWSATSWKCDLLPHLRLRPNLTMTRAALHPRFYFLFKSRKKGMNLLQQIVRHSPHTHPRHQTFTTPCVKKVIHHAGHLRHTVWGECQCGESEMQPCLHKDWVWVLLPEKWTSCGKWLMADKSFSSRRSKSSTRTGPATEVKIIFIPFTRFHRS